MCRGNLGVIYRIFLQTRNSMTGFYWLGSEKEGQVINKNLFIQLQPPEKYLEQIKKSSKIMQEQKTLITVSVWFWLPLQKFDLWKEDWALGSVFNQFWPFRNISKFPKILSIKSFSNPWDTLRTIILASCSNIDVSDVVKFQNIMPKTLGDCHTRLKSVLWDGHKDVFQEGSMVT